MYIYYITINISNTFLFCFYILQQDKKEVKQEAKEEIEEDVEDDMNTQKQRGRLLPTVNFLSL